MSDAERPRDDCEFHRADPHWALPPVWMRWPLRIICVLLLPKMARDLLRPWVGPKVPP
jgi:hypothetical protein